LNQYSYGSFKTEKKHTMDKHYLPQSAKIYALTALGEQLHESRRMTVICLEISVDFFLILRREENIANPW